MRLLMSVPQFSQFFMSNPFSWSICSFGEKFLGLAIKLFPPHVLIAKGVLRFLGGHQLLARKRYQTVT